MLQQAQTELIKTELNNYYEIYRKEKVHGWANNSNFFNSSEKQFFQRSSKYTPSFSFEKP